jgi:uncharacterized protein
MDDHRRRVASNLARRTPVQFSRMKKLTKVAAILRVAVGWIVLGTAVWVAAEPIASLRPSNYVNDFAGVLDAPTLASLNDLCQQIDQKAKAQIAVVTVKSLDGQDPVSYAVALYQKWGIGAKGKDRGVLILLATDDHKYWTTVGYGLEGILPDGKVGGFGRDMVPQLRSGDYAGAVTSITSRVATVIAQDAGVSLENAPRVAMPRRQPSNNGGGVAAFVVILIIIIVLSSLRGGGGLLGFLLGLLLSGGGGFGGGRGGYGGGGFGGGGGGGGFGGFGGGSTGGGGAGGSW